MNRIKIKSVHIKNYRSIKDSKKIEINDKVTIFAGKNESGKTNILTAIQAFYNDEFKEDDVPVDNRNSNPEIKINFTMNKEYIYEKLNIQAEDNREEYSLCVTRSKKYIDKYEGSVIEIINKIFFDKFNQKEEYLNYMNETEALNLIRLIIKKRNILILLIKI